MAFTLAGTAKLSSGANATRVLIHDWATGAFEYSLTPSGPTGAWSQSSVTDKPYLVTIIGPSGYYPRSDGPVYPVDI